MFFQTPFLYTPHVYEIEEEEELVMGRIDFSREETARLHASCKAHGRTLTQVMTALLSLAHVERELRVAEGVSDAQHVLVISAFLKASHIFSSFNFVNMVSRVQCL